MQALAAESRHRLGALAEAMAGLSVAERPLASWIQSGRPPHFFIVDDDMARLEMARTLLEEGRSRRFYARLRQASVVPGLDALLDAFIMQSRAHCQLLDETRQQLPACHRPLGSVPPGRGAARRRRRRLP
ncbi:hypothetical protein [Halomonas sp. M4R1S46]|uniref:hypothetical protein n=1 Tax=Halomonas sp. M4R1S46 TaxID=2982692 RepID=UPI0021E43F90|nr:hypothetical protein [Halomonas sp. M4R1S46]UYG09524.1 hypothetical protein OCT48_09395 [Halomonas sp. M4R1S46]